MKTIHSWVFWTLVFSSGLMIGPHLWADRCVVPPDTPGVISAPPYNAWTNAATNIQMAVDATGAGGGETILVTNGTYYANGSEKSFLGTTLIYITNRVHVRSVNGPEVTILDGGYPALTNRGVTLSYTGAIFSEFTIQNACAYRGGGGLIGSWGGTISNCWFISNTAAHATETEGGGGIANYTTTGITGLFANCTIRGNRCLIGNRHGGGGWFRGQGQVKDCLFINNSSSGTGNGGGAYILGTIQMERCLALSNSAAGGFGGGFYSDSGLRAVSCTSIYNTASRGGGVSLNTTAQLRDCLIAYNTSAGYGGGGYSPATCTSFLFENCVIRSNVSPPAGLSAGGGFYFFGTGIRLVNSIIESNYTYACGGISHQGSFLSITNCIIRQNRSTQWSQGAGVYMNGPGRIVGCLIVSNSISQVYSGSVGGGLKIANASVACENCTIVGNNASSSGAGGGLYMTAAAQVMNTIIYGNSAGSSPNWYSSAGTFSNCCSDTTNGMAGANNLAANPLLVDTNAGNYRLSSASSCIRAGLPQEWMTGALDLDGFPRMRGGFVDIGCYEFFPRGAVITVY